jgi:hypothetical protein
MSSAKKIRIFGRSTAIGSSWDSLGFHDSPYTPLAGLPYTNYTATGAEGELLDPISNQTYNVSADFDHTLYIVRAVSPNASPLRVQWFNGATVLSEQTGFQTLEAIKPAGATTMLADLSGAAFEQISVVLDGKLETFSNAGFEDGDFTDWSTTQQTGMGRANIADSRLEGTRACELTATVGAINGKYAQAFHEFDISGDPTNTHYVVEYDTLSENLEGSSLQTHVKIYSSSNTVLRLEYFDTLETPNTTQRQSAGFRKRDTDHVKLRFIIRLTRYTYGLLMTDLLQEHFIGNWDMTCFWDNARQDVNGLMSVSHDYRMNPFHLGMDLLADAQGARMMTVKTNHSFVYGFAAMKNDRILLYLINKTKQEQELEITLTAGSVSSVSGRIMQDTPDHWGELSELPVSRGKISK